MKKLMKNLKATEVCGVINLVLGVSLGLVALCTGDLMTSVNSGLLVISGIVLTNLK